MKSDIIHTDDGLRLTYFSKSDPSISITVSRGAIYEASRVADEWNPAAFSGMGRFADGDFSFATVCQARWGVKEKLAIQGEAPALGGLMLNCTKGIKIIVTLDPSDTYTVKVGRMGRGARRLDFVVAGEASDVYADVLVQVTDRLFSEAFGSL